MTLKQAVKQTEKKFERIITAIVEGDYIKSASIHDRTVCPICVFYGGDENTMPNCRSCPLKKIGKKRCMDNNSLWVLYRNCVLLGNKYYALPDESIPNLLALYMWLPMLLEVE